MSKRKEILVPGTSLVGLKAELLKKTQEFQVEKDGGGSSSIAGTAASHGKVISEEGVVLGGPKFKISKTTPAATANRNNGQTRGGSRRGSTSLQSNNEDETLETPGHVLEASWIALQRKAKEYEKLKKTALQDDDEDNNNSNNNQRIKEVLVDFVMKHADNDDHHSDQNSSNSSDAGSDHDKKNTQRSKQQPPNASKKSDPWVEVTDEFGRTRIVRQSAAEKIAMRGFVKGDDNGTGSSSSAVPHSMMSQDMLREQERLEWEANALKEISVEPSRHYNSKKEIRTLGTGFYQFSNDTDERREQMDKLNQIRSQTVDMRESTTKLKDKKKAALEDRRRQIIQRSEKLKRQRLEQQQQQQQQEASTVSAVKGGSSTYSLQEESAAAAAVADSFLTSLQDQL